MIGGFKYDDTVPTQQSVLKILRLLRPAAVVGHQMTRVGRIHDGGYVMVNDFDRCDAVYSFGISDEVSWDRQMATYGLDIYQYDHTIEHLPEANPRFKWRQIGIAGRPNLEERLDSLENIVRSNNHANADLILKCDIEGAEYEMFADTNSVMLNRFRQIVVEMHGFERLTDANYATTVHKAIANLCETHRVVHVHANNHCGYAILGGLPVPSVMEFTLLRRESYDFEETFNTFPTILDSPCYPFRADYYLGAFIF